MTIPSVFFSHKQSNQAEIQIFDISSLKVRTNSLIDPQTPHRLEFYMFIFIQAGEGHHMVDFEVYELKMGSTIFIQPDQVHSFDFTENYEGVVLVFTQNFLDQVHTNMLLPNYTPTHLNSAHSPLQHVSRYLYSRVLTLTQEILTEQNDTDRDPLIIMYLFSALMMILRKEQIHSYTGDLSKSQSTNLAKFFELLKNHYKEIRDATWYASQLGITYKTLNHVCKCATGLTVKQMVNAFVVIEIKRQLVVRKVTCQQIAYEFGFEDASNFVKYFKKNTSLTPSQFQRKFQS